MLLIPMGASFVYPFSQHKIIIGAKIYYSTSFVDNTKGSFHTKGTRYIDTDSSYSYDITYEDNQINSLAPRYQYGFHLGYEYALQNKMSISLRTEMYKGVLQEQGFNQIAIKLGLVYKLIDYKSQKPFGKKKRIESEFY